MFTGIVGEIGAVKSVHTQQSIRTLDVSYQKILENMHIGDSVGIDGACLTVVDFQQNRFSVQVIEGTKNKTYLANIKEDDKINLERAMSDGGRLGRHFVLGRVDAKGTIIDIGETPNSRIASIRASNSITKRMVKQGSITIDGVNLTIFDLHQHSFDIHPIPEIKRLTILSNKKIGDEVHLETDVLFKYAESIVGKDKSDLSVDKLKAYGF